MNIQSLFSTKQRELIMNYLLENPSKEINMSQIAKNLKMSRSQVHKYISILRNFGLVKGKKLLNMPSINSFRLTRNLIKIGETRIVSLVRKNFPKVQGIGLYGSWSKGTNDETADLDLWIKMKKSASDAEIAQARREVEQKIGKPVDITILAPEIIKNLREKNDSFYFSLYHGITLWGEGL